ncbi:Lrp/AsnC family transcriptional regulator [Croceiramulus getboli]|nr:Lrp/AsnC family transcriptional regulator [Flavobacteriaceae bacterium YJPT1-3]
MKLDVIDKRLLALLQADSKQTTKALAHQLDLSATAVYERIKKLERKGVISSYVALLDPAQVKRDFVVFCHVRLTQHSKNYLQTFEKAVVALDEVSECVHVSGDYDYILKVHVADMQAYRAFMVNKLTTLDHIGSTQSMFVINRVKYSTALNV